MARMKLADSIDAKIAKARDAVVRVKGYHSLWNYQGFLPETPLKSLNQEELVVLAK